MGKLVQYGGQAVIEGVMMRGPLEVALAALKGVLDSGQELT